MLIGTHLALESPAHDEDVRQEWYMNKSLKSTTVKVLHFVNERSCRMRLMEDLLRGHQILIAVQPFCQDSTHRGSCIVANTAKVDCDSRCGHSIMNKMTLTEADEDDDIGKMTLKEMQCLLRRNAQKSLKKQSSAVFSSVPLPEAGSNLGDKACVSETLPSNESSVQLGVLQLHLDSSTSNSAESGDDVSPRFVATSFHKPLDSVVKCEALNEDDDPDLKSKKRKSMTSPLLFENGISLEDDECTLQMWQAYRRRVRGGKRFGGCAAEPAGCGMAEQLPSASLITPAVMQVCSTSSVPDIADFDESPSVCAVEGTALGTCDSTVSCSIVCEDLKANSSLNPSSHEAVAEDGSPDNGLDFKVESKKLGETCKEDDESKEGHSSMVCESFRARLTEGSPQKINAGKNSSSVRASSWTLRPCKVDVSACALSKVDNTHISRQEPIMSCEIALYTDESASSVVEPCTNTCSKANIDSTGMEPTVLPPQEVCRTAIPCEHHNEVASCSSTLSIKESFPVHGSEDCSPTFEEPQTGLDIIEESSQQTVVMVSELSNDETSGSPVSLFSTERLDAEEEQAVEQQKPSKIPCKRKAISPLSRERLLQASRFGERDRVFYEVDKRGLKKLPRAFKGFIGRDTSNHEFVDVYAKARRHVIMESSPPEKLVEKEENLLGSPCHNRKKFLSANSYLPKTSSPAPCGDSITATTTASSLQASLPSPSCMQRLSLVLNSSPSPPSQQNPKPINGKSPANLSPSLPTKGILRSSPPTCQGACKCEECVSLRCRAERAAEFSQRQMQDIEGLAVRLLKELNTMRCVVEESLIQKSASRVDSPRSALSSEQVKRAANNALETEKMAKSWLVRMARDCNRYCKIMRMQERKLRFADESGGQLCHVKLFHSQPKLQPEAMLSNAIKEHMATSSALDKEDPCRSPSEINEAIE